MPEGMVEVITKPLKKNESIRISGLGIIQVRKRPASMGRNPATGEAIKASKKIALRAAKDLKRAIYQGALLPTRAPRGGVSFSAEPNQLVGKTSLKANVCSGSRLTIVAKPDSR